MRGVIHWVTAEHSAEAEVRVYERLFSDLNPDGNREVESFLELINPDSLTSLSGCRVEPTLAQSQPGDRFQFEREGYYCRDPEGAAEGRLVFNLTVGLRDTGAKAAI